ncbi:MAG: hypothetical protein OEV54_07155 [Dehalococcoidia bacterium]|nr:hypothetical protein [Dehalococcoidia bacterium]
MKSKGFPVLRDNEDWDRQEAASITEGCWKCNNPDVVDTSYFWELRLEPSWNLLKTFLPE